jgi:hypothetical protein
MPGAIPHHKAGVQFLDSPRRREAAGCHGVLSHRYADNMLPLGWGRRHAHFRLHPDWLFAHWFFARVHAFGGGEGYPAT